MPKNEQQGKFIDPNVAAFLSMFTGRPLQQMPTGEVQPANMKMPTGLDLMNLQGGGSRLAPSWTPFGRGGGRLDANFNPIFGSDLGNYTQQNPQGLGATFPGAQMRGAQAPAQAPAQGGPQLFGAAQQYEPQQYQSPAPGGQGPPMFTTANAAYGTDFRSSPQTTIAEMQQPGGRMPPVANAAYGTDSRSLAAIPPGMRSNWQFAGLDRNAEMQQQGGGALAPPPPTWQDAMGGSLAALMTGGVGGIAQAFQNPFLNPIRKNPYNWWQT